MTAFLQKCGEELISRATANDVNADSQEAIFCHTCCNNLKKKTCPKLSIANGMEVDEIPEELMKTTDLEQQLFARMLVFTKIVQLPNRTGKRMKGLTGKMINVPLEQSDISNSIRALPRCVNDAAVVALQLKKKQEHKSAYAEAFIRPEVCIKAVEKLKELENPHYKDIEIDPKFMDKGKKEKEQHEKDDNTQEESENSEDDEKMEDVEMLNSVKEFQAEREENTCLIREDLEAIIVENKSKKTINKKKGKNVISIQPGENKVHYYKLFSNNYSKTIIVIFSRYPISF